MSSVKSEQEYPMFSAVSGEKINHIKSGGENMAQVTTGVFILVYIMLVLIGSLVH